MSSIGFIITRHVNSEVTNEYWLHCYNCIRKFYDWKIIIIDDNSNYSFVNDKKIKLINCEIIQSEYPQRGELLGYYYFHKKRFFEKAIIMHDSMFIQKYIDFESCKNVKFFWNFRHIWDKPIDEMNLLHKMKLDENIYEKLLELYFNPNHWHGCFGVQSVIEYSYLYKLNEKYNFLSLLKYVNSRILRMGCERIFGLICSYENSENFMENPTIFGDIHAYTLFVTNHRLDYDYYYDYYLYDKENGRINENAQIVKINSGR